MEFAHKLELARFDWGKVKFVMNYELKFPVNSVSADENCEFVLGLRPRLGLFRLFG